jgi:methionyl-tRNA formyltransferase
MSKLRIVILCGRSPRHLYVANALCRVVQPLAIVQEVGSQWSMKRTIKLFRPRNLFHKVWRWLRDRRRYAGGKEAKFFFGERLPCLDREDLRVEVPHINHPDVVALVDRLKPDAIAVFGTSLIRGELLSRGKYGIFNLHGGLSPHYRGADCTFWALHNGEPEQVGCTLHHVDAGIDTGKIVAYVCPEIQPDDDELILFWRAVRDTATVFAQLFERLARGDKLGQLQRSKGHLYQVKDRGWRQERELERRLKGGMLDKVRLVRRVRWFDAPHDPKSVLFGDSDQAPGGCSTVLD